MSNTTIHEAVGIFVDRPHLEDALIDLRNAGFDKEEIGLLAGERAVKRSLQQPGRPLIPRCQGFNTLLAT